jgi:hypothetical protein
LLAYWAAVFARLASRAHMLFFAMSNCRVI